MQKLMMGTSLDTHLTLKPSGCSTQEDRQIEGTLACYTLMRGIKSIMFTNTSVDEIGIDDSSRYPPDEFLQENDLSRQYQTNSDISYYIIPHGRPLTELTQEKHVSEDGQINHQPTEEASKNRTKTLICITKTLVFEAHRSQDTNHASTSSYPVAQDRLSRDQHIELVNIIGDPGEGMLTRSMTAKLIVPQLVNVYLLTFSLR
ncbi:hypothetical protein Tco_0300145 [Tanacetum coccineum]